MTPPRRGIASTTVRRREPLRNAVRIIGGAWRRRLVRFPDLPDLRPTPDRVRETLFNWLGQDLTGLSCLDLFAGSGALGLEAASRGASRVALVEPEPRAHAALVENIAALGAAQARAEKGHALEFLSRTTARFDVVFLDPPFRSGVAAPLLEAVARVLSQDARVYVESDEPFAAPPGWTTIRQARAGRVHYQLLRRAAADNDGDDR